MIQQTSINAFLQAIDGYEIESQTNKIYRYMKTQGNMTNDHMISRDTKIPQHLVPDRRKRLIQADKICFVGNYLCPINLAAGKKIYTKFWRVKE